MPAANMAYSPRNLRVQVQFSYSPALTQHLGVRVGISVTQQTLCYHGPTRSDDWSSGTELEVQRDQQRFASYATKRTPLTQGRGQRR